MDPVSTMGKKVKMGKKKKKHAPIEVMIIL